MAIPVTAPIQNAAIERMAAKIRLQKQLQAKYGVDHVTVLEAGGWLVKEKAADFKKGKLR